jgi:hypothetical protein
MHRSIFIAVIGISFGLLTGCATITTGTTQNIAVTTDPDGADCSFSRNDQFIARVNPTPGSLSISKSGSSLSVSCKREGYHDTAETIGSDFQAVTLGNVLIGGVIGIVVDAASGAINKYPESIAFKLLPLVFQTAEQRERFFDGLKATSVLTYTRAAADIERSCRPEECVALLKSAEAARDARAVDIERRRLLAKVTPADTAAIAATSATASARPSLQRLSRTEVEAMTRGKTWDFGTLETGAASTWEFSGSAVYGRGRGSFQYSGDWRLNEKAELCVHWTTRQFVDRCVWVARRGDKFVLMDSKTPEIEFATVSVK